jgi:hypothetical protein
MYIQHKGLSSIVYGTDIIDAIKKSNRNAILVWIEDEDGVEYFVREHNECDSRGYFNYYWVDEYGNILYDESTTEPEPKPETINMINTTTDSGWINTNGKFYECGFEQHISLADFLMETGVVPYVSENAERYLEEKNWLKLSNGEIRYNLRNPLRDKLTKKQKQTIVNYFTTKKKLINILGRNYTENDFYENL